MHDDCDPPVAHRDLKPENILIIKNGFYIKICDLGIARLLKRFHNTYRAKTEKIAGTIIYMAPETFDDAAVTRAIDVWAFGIILDQMISREEPFSKMNDQQLLRFLMKKEQNYEINPKARGLLR